MTKDKVEEEIEYQCPGCDSKDVEEKILLDTFSAMIDGKEVELSTSVPVICCKHCDEKLTDFRAEEIRDTLVRNIRIKVL